MADAFAAQFAAATPVAVQPLALMADRGKQAEYPVDALGPILGAATRATAVHAYVPLSIAAQSIITACSLAVQPHFDVVLPTGQVRPTSLFAVTVADSGDRKSTSDDYVMSPIWEYQEQLEEKYATKKLDALLAQSAWDETKKAVTQRLKNRGKEALEAGYRELGQRPDGPIDPTIVIRSGTTQGLLKRFITSRPSLGLMSDEGGSWLGGFGMTEDNRLLTISTLSDFWDGKTVQTNTGGEGFTALRGCRLTFHLMIQPVLSGKLLGNAEAQGQGFLSRLLVSHPESIAGTRFVKPGDRDAPEHLAAVTAYRDRLSQIVCAPLPVKPDSTALDPRPLQLSAQAKEMWWAFYNSIEARLGPDGDLNQVKGFVGKLPEQAARLAANIGVFHKGIRIEEIDAQTLANGIALAEFYLSEAVRLFGQASPGGITEDAQLLSDWIASKWTENLISVTAIQQTGPSRVRQGADHIRALIEILVRHDHLSDRLPGGGMVSGKKVREAWRVIVGRG
jgi:hypothetical protein